MFSPARIGRGTGLALSAVTALTMMAPGLGAAQAASVGTADAAQLGLQPSDFAPGATVSEGAGAGGPGVLSSHERSFVTPTTRDGLTFMAIYSMVSVDRDQQTAQAQFDGMSRLLRSQRGRNGMAQDLLRGLGQSGLHPPRRAIHFGRVRTPAIGDAAFLTPFTMKVKGLRFSFSVVGERVNRGVALLVFGSLGGQPQTGAVMALARTEADRMRAGLASGA